MARGKSFVQIVYEVTCALGALACVLVWLGIKPKDFKAITLTLPHWLLLAASLLLFSASLVSSYAWRHLTEPVDKSLEESPKLSKPVSLEIRPSPGEVLKSFVERAHGETHYRMEIYNSGPEAARNVQVRLIKIEPLPISEYFRARADFPCHVRLAHLADGNVDSSTDHDINPGTSEHFELLYFWESSDHRIIVDGIDTKQAHSRDARFPIEENECWHLKYEVSSTHSGIQRPSYLVRRDGNNLLMSRLV